MGNSDSFPTCAWSSTDPLSFSWAQANYVRTLTLDGTVALSRNLTVLVTDSVSQILPQQHIPTPTATVSLLDSRDIVYAWSHDGDEGHGLDHVTPTHHRPPQARPPPPPLPGPQPPPLGTPRPLLTQHPQGQARQFPPRQPPPPRLQVMSPPSGPRLSQLARRLPWIRPQRRLRVRVPPGRRQWCCDSRDQGKGGQVRVILWDPLM